MRLYKPLAVTLAFLFLVALAGAPGFQVSNAAAQVYESVTVTSSPNSPTSFRVNWHAHDTATGNAVASSGKIMYGDSPTGLTTELTTGCYPGPCDVTTTYHVAYIDGIAGRTIYYKIIPLDGTFQETGVYSFSLPMWESGQIYTSQSNIGSSSAEVGWTLGFYAVGHAVPASGVVEIGTASGGPYTEVITGCTPDPCSTWSLLHSVDLTGLSPARTYYWRVKSLDGQFTYGLEHSFTTLGSSLPPTLSLSLSAVRWDSYADYLASELTVDWSIANNAGFSAINANIVGDITSNGVFMTNATPFAVGDIPDGMTGSFSTRYHVPPGVNYFRTQLYLTAQDAGGTTYSYPGPFPNS